MSFKSALGDLGNQISKNFDGQLNKSDEDTGYQKTDTILPWNNSKASTFFRPINIDPAKWDKLFPYRLIVVNTLNGNTVVNGTKEMNIKITRDLSRSAIDFTPMTNQWIYTLPITPQQLQITDQYAIQTTATLLGIVEEHSGVRFKMINAQGTMGVWTHRGSVVAPPVDSSVNVIQSIFGGTIEAINSTLSQVARTINTITSNHPATKPVSKRPEKTSPGLTSTGYFYALALQQFLEQYAEAKKDPKNAGWRLVFDIPKQNQSLVVTPMQFNWTQNAQKPMEITYSLSMKAWRRIELGASLFENKRVESLTPGILQRIMNSVSEARKTLSSVTNLIGAVRSDVIRPLEVLRQTSLFVKDLAGVALTAADLPFQVQRDYKYALSDFFKSLATDEILRSAATDPASAQALKDLQISWERAEGTSAGGVRTGNLGPGAAQAQSIDPGLAIFDKPEKAHNLIDKASVFALQITDSQKESIDAAVEAARQITVDDLKQFRAVIHELSIQLSNNFGAGDPYYNKIYGRPTPSSRIQEMTLDEYEILQVLYDVMQSYDIMTATTSIDDANRKTNMEYVAGLAEEAGMLFDNSESKILVPVPFGASIEAIAARYLGNAQRWLEIATLNNLRSPYIDENGFKYPLLSNASGRQVTISSQENLYIGQRIVIASSSQPQTARKILDLNRLSDTSFLLTLDGEANLDNFIVSNAAYLQAYMPGTVNSQQKIFIPSEVPVSQDARITVPSSVQADPLVGLSKVDWLLTDTGDLAVNSFGDFRFSAGLTNLIQALRIKIGTQKGRVLLHPAFGLSVKSGDMVSDTDVSNVFDDLNKLISDDSRFDGLDSLQVIINGPTMTINMGVRLAGNNGVFPIAFNVPA